MLGKYIGSVFAGVERISAKITPSHKGWKPAWLRLPSIEAFNFIFWHYMYILIMAFIISGVMSGLQNVDYIDCLFFAAGSTTQSGLNTIDVNQLATYQQTALLIGAMLCNPITINMFVVFVRLYWFEKRFQHIIKNAKAFSKARTMSRSKSMALKDVEEGRTNPGVNGRQINIVRSDPLNDPNEKNQVLFDQTKPESERSGSSTDIEVEKDKAQQNEEQASSNPAPPQRNIMFADNVSNPKILQGQIGHHRRTSSANERLPIGRSPEQHIAFVENQRRPKDDTVLRIPGPRDFDRGEVPERIENDTDEDELPRPGSQGVAKRSGQIDMRNPGEINQDDHPLKPEFTNNTDEENGQQSKFRKLRNRLSLLTSNDNTHPPLTLKERAMSGGRSFARFLSQERGGADEHDPNPYLSYQPTIGRNSVFHNLTEEQREELGGIEYRALKTLAYILMIYFWGWSIFAIITFLPWIQTSSEYQEVVDSVGMGVTWWGLFTPMSHFTDLGFTLTPDSMISFQQALLPMLVGSFLIIIGNTGFPIMLRFMIWCGSHLVPHGSAVWEELRFLLDHPRRCFTLLFPRRATWWLFAILVLLNGIDLIFFVVLDLNDPTVTSLSPGFQFLDGLYQAASTRTAGFACVNLADLHPGIQVSYLIMMYISVFPIAISVRQTNVYEENSLGIYGAADELDDPDADPNTTRRSYIGAHLRRQLSFDLWFVFLGLFFITIIEGDRIADNAQPTFTVFTCLFEIVSAYGTVGLSLGFPGINASFSAEFHALSKLIIIAMMIRGRHRGLPYALDRAILLPSEGLQRKEAAEDARRARRASSFAEATRPSMSRDGHGATTERPERAVASGLLAPGPTRDVPIASRHNHGISMAPTVMDDEHVDFRPVFGASATNATSNPPNRRSTFTKILSGVLSAGPTSKKHA